MKIYEIQYPVVEVVCRHPEDSSRYYNFGIDASESYNPFDEEEYEAFMEDLKESINNRVNKYGYWHEVVITLVHEIDGKVYRKEI